MVAAEKSVVNVFTLSEKGGLVLADTLSNLEQRIIVVGHRGIRLSTAGLQETRQLVVVENTCITGLIGLEFCIGKARLRGMHRLDAGPANQAIILAEVLSGKAILVGDKVIDPDIWN